MTVPTVATYSAASLVAAQTSFLNLLDVSASAASIKIRDSIDVLLAEVTLDDPAGAVNGTTGQLAITAPGAVVAVASGTAAYGEFCDGDGIVLLSLPASEGVTSVDGYIVLNTLSIIDGQPVGIVTSTIG